MIVQAQALSRGQIVFFETCEVSTPREAELLRVKFEKRTGDPAEVRIVAHDSPLCIGGISDAQPFA